MSATFRGMLAASLAAAIWGGMYVVSRLVLGVIPPLTLLCCIANRFFRNSDLVAIDQTVI